MWKEAPSAVAGREEERGLASAIIRESKKTRGLKIWRVAIATEVGSWRWKASNKVQGEQRTKMGLNRNAGAKMAGKARGGCSRRGD